VRSGHRLPVVLRNTAVGHRAPKQCMFLYEIVVVLVVMIIIKIIVITLREYYASQISPFGLKFVIDIIYHMY
jgi:hypothetical protein